METKMTPEEYSKIESFLAQQAVNKLGISDRAARLRVRAIVKSGLLSKFGYPHEVTFQIAIDAAMMIPQMGESES